MSIASDAVTTFRSLWSDRFVDACEIVDPLNSTDRGVMDPVSYQYDTQTSKIVYTGSCLIRPANMADEAVLYGQQAVTFTAADIYVPYDAAAVDLDQEVLVTASVTDTQLVGTLWVIRSIVRDSYHTRRKLAVELNLGTGLAY